MRAKKDSSSQKENGALLGAVAALAIIGIVLWALTSYVSVKSASPLVLKDYDANSNAFVLTNTGGYIVESYSVYVDDVQFPATFEAIAPGESKDVFILEPLEAGLHTIKVSSPSGTSSLRVNVPSMWFVELTATRT